MTSTERRSAGGCCEGLIRGPSQTDPLQVLPVPLRALLRVAHSGDHVLLHHDPAAVPSPPELAEDGLEVHVAVPQLAEDALLDRLHRVPALPPGPGRNLRVVVLEVHVPDAVGVAPDALDRIAAAEAVVPRVEAEPEDLGVGHGEETGRLLRRLDPGADVVVEDGAEHCLALHGP